MFTLNNIYLCIVDCQSKIPVIKKTENLSADSLILTCKIIFSEYGLPKKIMSDAGSNFVSDQFKQYCKKLNIEKATSSCHHQNIKFIKHTIKIH